MHGNGKPKGAQIGWRRLETQVLFRSPWYEIRQDAVELPGGEQTTFTFMEHPGAVFVVPVTKEREILLIRSYRYAVDDWCWEVPAGFLGDKEALAPEDMARQELAEETGGVAERLDSLGAYYAVSGVAHIRVHYFLARNVTLAQAPRLEATETIDCIKAFSVARAIEMVRDGIVSNGESAFAILLAASRV